jgi:hypothetical protein
MIQKEPVDKMKMAELKSQGNKAAGRKNFLSAAEFYSMLCYGTVCFVYRQPLILLLASPSTAFCIKDTRFMYD